MGDEKVAKDTATGPKPRRRWPRRLAIGAAISTALFGLLGFFIAPPIAQSVAQKQLGALLGRRVAIGRVRINPFALSLAVEDFQIFEADQTTPFVGFRRLYVNAQLSSVFRRAPVIKEVSLEGLRVRVVREKATDEEFADIASAYNFSDIVARFAAMPKDPNPPPSPDPNAPPPRFSLNNLRLVDGAVTFDDRPLHAHHEITDLAIGVPFASTLPVYLDSFVQPGLSVRVDGTPFSVDGRTKPFKDSLETVLELRLASLDLTKYLPFVPLALPVVIPSASLSLALDVTFVRPSADTPRLTLKGSIDLDKLDVREKRKAGPSPLVALDKLEIVIGESDLTAQKIRVEKVLLSGLDVHARRLPDGSMNFEHLAPRASVEEKSPASRHEKAQRKQEVAEEKAKAKVEAQEGGPQWSLGVFALEKSSAHFRDETVSPAFETDVSDLDVAVHGLSNAAGATAKMTVRLRAEPGGTVTQAGTLRLTPLAATGTVTVEGIEPGRFSSYTRDALTFDVTKGRVRVGSAYEFEQGKAHPTIRLSDAFFELSDLTLHRRTARDDFVHLGALAVHGAKVDVGAQTVSIAELTTHDGRVRAQRDAKGVVDLTTLVASTAPAHGAAPPARPAPIAPPVASPVASSPGWKVELARFDLEKWGARFEDHAVKPTAVLTVDPIALQLKNVSTAPGARMGVDLRLGLNKTGKLQVSGTVAPQPLAANVKVDLKTLEILPLQPYFGDQVGLTVTDGTVSLKAQAAVKMGSGPDPKIDLTADLDVANVATTDRFKQESLLKWKSFHVGGAHVASPPMSIAIDEIALTDFATRLVLTPEGQLNLQEALAPPGAAPPEKKKPVAAKAPAKAPVAPEPPPPDVKIAHVTLQAGNVTFTDRMIRPSYSAELTELAGRISGLSSTPGTTADVDIRGSVNHSGVLTILGKANPLAKVLFADVQVNLRDFELPPASPYTGKYVGLAISKGKLDLSLDYKIAGGKLDAKNKLVLDQFTFGDKVPSPDAVNLPVRLAVALLKDRRGVIDIDLPIAGSLEDPQFKIWGAVLKVLGNLVVKAVTAPFSLIATAFGGGDELSHIDFSPGLYALDATAKKRLVTLTKALQERPGISFEIEGGADPKHDRDGLRVYLFDRKLKAVKMTELVQAGTAVASVNDVVIPPAERDALLAKAYDAEKFPKPKNAVGLEKSLPPPEQEKLMLANTRVDDDELRALALRRATAVQATIAKTSPGTASRLFLVTPRLAEAARVEMKLKKD